jgi:hypothetical protein
LLPEAFFEHEFGSVLCEDRTAKAVVDAHRSHVDVLMDVVGAADGNGRGRGMICCGNISGFEAQIASMGRCGSNCANRGSEAPKSRQNHLVADIGRAV